MSRAGRRKIESLTMDPFLTFLHTATRRNAIDWVVRHTRGAWDRVGAGSAAELVLRRGCAGADGQW